VKRAPAPVREPATSRSVRRPNFDLKTDGCWSKKSSGSGVQHNANPRKPRRMAPYKRPEVNSQPFNAIQLPAGRKRKPDHRTRSSCRRDGFAGAVLVTPFLPLFSSVITAHAASLQGPRSDEARMVAGKGENHSSSPNRKTQLSISTGRTCEP